MDELKLNLSSKLMKGIVTKLLSAAIQKKLGYKVNIQLHELTTTVQDGKAQIHIHADGEMEKDEFMKLITKTGLG